MSYFSEKKKILQDTSHKCFLRTVNKFLITDRFAICHHSQRMTTNNEHILAKIK
jgi:hypothetical protein